ncbi:MAG TPA: dihydropteroate synthase [Candidatus Omnitrophota bacterium]|nr:dihydropteroate synthase [Candidatus Omnitrophota bacterium]HPT38899.1 dihydropteroate synthase [Candidatus Omnitrophota bacterium]
MSEIGADPYGIKIMLPKASAFLIRLKAVNNVVANILKQEMLALGADAAVARGSLTGSIKKTDILLIGQLAQFNALISKLKIQPFGLQKLAEDLDGSIKKFTQTDFVLALRKGRLDLGQRAKIMGIINLTPDSFSHDGIYQRFNRDYLDLALKKAQALVKDGADLIDLGGQSSRPGAKSVSIKEELRRTEPVVKFLVKKIKVPISVDTNKPEVAKAVLDAGAQIINDISGLRDSRMIKVVARFKAAVVIMHMLGKPVNMQKNIVYESLIDDITGFLRNSIDAAQAGGILPEKIMVDPGLGFGKNPGQNLEIIKHLEEFKPLGKPILIGPSRKSFIAKVLKSDSENRSSGSIAACVMAVERGANIVRVHDVKEVSQALKITESVLKNVNS